MRVEKHKKIRNFLFAPPTLLVFFLITVFVLISAFSLFSKRNDVWAKANRAHLVEKELLKKKEDLAHDTNRIQTEEGLQSAIREKFHLAKEGEGLIVLTENKEINMSGDEKVSKWRTLKEKISTFFK